MISREEVRVKLGEVCPYCVRWFYCEKAIELQSEGCEEFELQTEVECDVPCGNCYLLVLGLCDAIGPEEEDDLLVE